MYQLYFCVPFKQIKPEDCRDLTKSSEMRKKHSLHFICMHKLFLQCCFLLETAAYTLSGLKSYFFPTKLFW